MRYERRNIKICLELRQTKRFAWSGARQKIAARCVRQKAELGGALDNKLCWGGASYKNCWELR